MENDLALMGVTTNGTGPLRKLSAVDTVFSATGTALIKVTRGSQETVLELPIQSVDVEEVTAMVGNGPKVPMRATGDRPKFVEDPSNPDYIRAQGIHTRRFLIAMACFGLLLDIEDEQGVVVWSADNSIHNLDAARTALKKMGLVDNQLTAITKAITELTQIVEETVTSD